MLVEIGVKIPKCKIIQKWRSKFSSGLKRAHWFFCWQAPSFSFSVVLWHSWWCRMFATQLKTMRRWRIILKEGVGCYIGVRVHYVGQSYYKRRNKKWVRSFDYNASKWREWEASREGLQMWKNEILMNSVVFQKGIA